MLLYVTKCQRLSGHVLVLSPTIRVGLSELECSGARILERWLQLGQVNKQTSKQTRFRASNSRMPIKFIALAPSLFMSVSDCVQGHWTAKLSSILTYSTSCRQRQANCQFTLEVQSCLTMIDSPEPQSQTDLTPTLSLFQANGFKM